MKIPLEKIEYKRIKTKDNTNTKVTSQVFKMYLRPVTCQ